MYPFNDVIRELAEERYFHELEEEDKGMSSAIVHQ